MPKRRPSPRSAKRSSTSRTVKLSPGAVALTIAGSDPSGGAGLQADLKTFQKLNVYGMSAITLLTVQNTQGVSRVEVLAPELVAAQYEACVSDIPPAAIKTGALGNAEMVEAVAALIAKAACPVVVDPVLVSKNGDSLVTDDVVKAYMRYMMPYAYLVTPNRFEAERLTGITLDSEDAVAKAVYKLHAAGAKHVLIKLGSVNNESQHILGFGDRNLAISTPRLDCTNTHGTGCILSAAITAKLALGEKDMHAATLFGIHRTFEAIQVDTELGEGHSPAETRAMRSNAE